MPGEAKKPGAFSGSPDLNNRRLSVNVTKQTEVAQEQTGTSLREHVLDALERYFAHLDGDQPIGVHNLVLEEVESALYEAIMKFTKGNQSKAAILMGVSRGTLRTKLKHYFSTTHIGLTEDAAQ
jgi:Fis family transcriptional regulator, factor for inversion stimulation protein